MNAEDLLNRWRIKLQEDSPFFSYLALFLKFEEKGEEFWKGSNSAGAGVDQLGNFYYKKEFIERLEDEEGTGLVIHEILHLALLHFARKFDDRVKGNIACDIAVNEVLKENKFVLPKGVIWTNSKNEVILFKNSPYAQKIVKCNEKTAEQLYDEIKMPEGFPGYEVTGYSDIDKHLEGLTPKEREQANEWLKKVEEAYVISKMRGNVPLGIERLIGKLKESKIDWRLLLRRYIQNAFPQDYTYSFPDKKSLSYGYYMPSVIKEGIEVVIVIDTSGSIGDQELTEFLSECTSIAKAFSSIKMKVITCDCEVHGVFDIDDKKIDKIKIKGGGGTSHVPVFSLLKDKYRNTKVAVFFTDGYSDLQSIKMQNYNFNKIFVISKDGNPDCVNKKHAHVVKL